jgi:hypothetical protein
MELQIPADNSFSCIPAPSAPTGPLAAAVLARPNVVTASLHTAGREAAPPTWYPDIQPLDFITDDKPVTPGYGESLPNCGTVRFTITCPDNQEHYTKLRKYSCHKSSCPTCWTTWASRLSKDAESRIDGSRLAYDLAYKARHISLSPDFVPFQSPTQDCLKWLYKEGNRLTKVLGITGCAVIIHPYRIRKETETFVYLASKKEQKNRYQWALHQENWQDYLYFSPHFHLIAYGKFMDADEFHTLTGWIYKNHDDNQKAGREGTELQKTIYYLLTHAWTKDNSVVLRYWGDLSNKRLQKIQIDERQEPILCPVCEKHMVKKLPDSIQFDGSLKPIYQDIHNCDKAYRKISIYTYKKRLKRAIS